MASLDPEVPEPDALEQAQAAVPGEHPSTASPRPKVPLEAPEADVLEQSFEVPDDEDDWR
ncbi:MAG TPA: hypothetical protein VME20_10980 [Acidimicrobiales bacterium]|nr:hypothetical protein [Acidimicrobiales bacterium]